MKDLPNYKFICGNICSSDLVNYVLQAEEIDTIMHFAAQTHVDNSFGNSFQFTQNNIMGTHVLLESAKVAGIKRFIHVSTDEVYGEQRLDQEAMDEEQVGHFISHFICRIGTSTNSIDRCTWSALPPSVSVCVCVCAGVGAHQSLRSYQGRR